MKIKISNGVVESKDKSRSWFVIFQNKIWFFAISKEQAKAVFEDIKANPQQFYDSGYLKYL